MRKLIVGAQVSLDGVMQSPGGKVEDPTGGFAFGGWAMPFTDEVFGEEIMRLFGDFELLLGRKTYEIFAAYWPFYDGEGSDDDDGIAKTFDRVKKHVVSASGDVELSWQGSSLLRDIEAVRRLKQTAGPDLVTQGSTALVQALFAADLVDAVSVFTFPVVLGAGKRLFADGAAAHAFSLTRSRVTPRGVVIGHYDRGGDVEVTDVMLEAPNDLERRRRERLARER